MSDPNRHPLNPPPNPTKNHCSPTPWRAGRSVHRTIYDANERLIGMMDTPEDAALVIAAVNARMRYLNPEQP